MIDRLMKFALVFVFLSAAAYVLSRYFQIELGNANYWDHHGLLFLGLLALFPRLTLLFSSVASGGLIWWLAWIFTPRVLVACLATISYWQQNPFLVAAAWVVAIGGESSEKYVVVRRSYLRRMDNPASYSRRARGPVIDIEPNKN